MIRRLHIILIFFILIRFEAVANVDSLKTLLHERNFSKVNKYVRALNNEKNTSTAYLSYNELLDSTYCATIQVQTIKTNDTVGIFEVHRYSIDLIIQDTSIVYFKMFDNGTALIGDSFEVINPVLILNYIDDIKIKVIIDKKNQNKSYSFEIDDFFNKSVIYGDACGIIGSPPLNRLIMQYFVNELDTNSLFTWLFAPIVELQVYAVEGFYLLEKKGVKLTEEQKQMILFIKKKKGNVRTCNGCRMNEISIKEACKKFKFKKRRNKQQ